MASQSQDSAGGSMNCLPRVSFPLSGLVGLINRIKRYMRFQTDGKGGHRAMFLRNVQGLKSRVDFVGQNKSRIRNRTHTHTRNRTLNCIFGVSLPYPCFRSKFINMKLYFKQLSALSQSKPISGFRVRKRGCIHVLPCRGLGGPVDKC